MDPGGPAAALGSLTRGRLVKCSESMFYSHRDRRLAGGREYMTKLIYLVPP